MATHFLKLCSECYRNVKVLRGRRTHKGSLLPLVIVYVVKESAMSKDNLFVPRKFPFILQDLITCFEGHFIFFESYSKFMLKQECISIEDISRKITIIAYAYKTVVENCRLHTKVV